ncbi:MAG TPA: hypothetical protein PLV68_04350, partial [Ilumatobacteraceae bacterium]|nr:hypothetical protein [Ilumatobacteraceae bacterium]
TVVAPHAASRRVACCFTGGIDSFYSIIAHRDEIDLLVFVHGFDLTDDEHSPLNRSVVARLYEAAAMLGKPMIEVTTGLKYFGAALGIDWNDYLGSAVAAVALLLAPTVSTFYIPATATYAEMYPLGTHPLLDPLWSTEAVRIVHDGAQATRVGKTRIVASEPAAQQHLRVCWEHRDGLYNCGRCEKCIRSAVGVRIAGVEGAFPALPSPSLRQIAGVNVVGLGKSWLGYRDELARSGRNPRLRFAIDVALWRWRVKRLKRLKSLPGLRRVWR